MWTKFKILGVLLLFVLTTPVYADNEIILQFGPPETSDGSYLGAGYRWNPLKKFSWLKCEAMVGIKNQNVFGGNPIGVFEISPAIELNPHFLYFRVSSGFAILTGTDYKLNSKWQFPTTVSGGLSHKNVKLGFMWKHYSNGTVSFGNRGWNFQGMEFIYKF